MRAQARPLSRLSFSVCLALAVIGGTAAAAVAAQQQPKEQPKASDAEVKEAQKVEAATDEPARLAAAAAFVKKYPKSELRMQVAQLVAGKINAVTEPAQQITLAESFRTTFAQPGEADLVNGTLIEAYLKAKRPADAFQLAAKTIDTIPNPVPVLVALADAGYAQAQQQDVQFLAKAIEYAGRGIELLEADKKPATVDATVWSNYKTGYLPHLYQARGFLQAVGGDAASAQTSLAKASTLDPGNPMNYGMMGNLRAGQYQDLAAKYKAATGAEQDALLKQVQALVDQIIDDYAHAVALAEGKPQFQPMRDQLLPDLQSFYKFRHNGSTDGLQQLIDKYKQPSAVKP